MKSDKCSFCDSMWMVAASGWKFRYCIRHVDEMEKKFPEWYKKNLADIID